MHKKNHRASRKKGMEMALGVIITIVVLVVVGLSVIVFSGKGIQKAGTSSVNQIDTTACQTAIAAACVANGISSGGILATHIAACGDAPATATTAAATTSRTCP